MVQTGIYTLSLVIISLLLIIVKNSQNPKRSIITYFFICLSWLIYIFIIQRTGLLDSLSFPPRVPLMIIIPATFGIIQLTKTKGMRYILSHTKRHIPILLQSFRIFVELLIYGSYIISVIPQRATFEGINYDILVGLSALIMGWLAFKNKISNRGLLIWNIVSLVILSVTAFSFVSSFYFTDFIVNNGGVNDFVKFPYLLIAAILLPIAIFLHVFSIRQLLEARKSVVQQPRSN